MGLLHDPRVAAAKATVHKPVATNLLKFDDAPGPTILATRSVDSTLDCPLRADAVVADGAVFFDDPSSCYMTLYRRRPRSFSAE